MAMSRLARGEIDPDLICGVCHKVYTSPRLLPCTHTFCLTCIQGLTLSHGLQFPCPQCRTTTRLPPSGPRGFPVNFYIKEEDLELARKGHTICPVHSKDKERLVFFCKVCDMSLCIRCKLTTHEGHTTEDLCRAAVRSARRLTASRNTLDKTIQRLEMKSQQIQYDLQAVNQKKTALKKQVMSKRDHLVNKIDRAVDEVMSDLESTSRWAQQRIQREASSVHKDLEFATQISDQVDEALDGTDADKLCTEKSLRQHEAKIEKTRKKAKVTVPWDPYRPVLDSEVDISDNTLLKFVRKPRPMVPLLSQEPCHRSILFGNPVGLPPLPPLDFSTRSYSLAGGFSFGSPWTTSYSSGDTWQLVAGIWTKRRL